MDRALFTTTPGSMVPPTDATNLAGGRAYSLAAKEALAQYSAACMFGSTFYASADEQLVQVLELAAQCEPMFVAKCAVYARQRGYLKDMPAFLLATLAGRGKMKFDENGARKALRAAWPNVIDNGKMLRNFAQVTRSGVAGRKSFGSHTKRLMANYLLERADKSPNGLFRDSVGDKPSLADVIKMVRPKPRTPEQAALFRYLIGKPTEGTTLLPETVRAYEAWKASADRSPLQVPDVPFQLLDSLGLDDAQWAQVAANAGWQMTRMNLNTFARHGVFKNKELTRAIADRLASPELVAKSRCYPYQLLTAFQNVGSDVPSEVRDSLQDAMEHAVANAPKFAGRVAICPDVSGSMSSPVSGNRPGATTKTSCVDVAALIAAVLMRNSAGHELLPFSDKLHLHSLNSRDSIMTLATQIASMGGGGTDCSLPLQHINAGQFGDFEAIVFISDNQSWIERGGGWPYRVGGTTLMKEFSKLLGRSPRTKLICIDLTPNATTQAPSAANRLNVGGFSDAVFDVVSTFASGSAANWVDQIEQVQL